MRVWRAGARSSETSVRTSLYLTDFVHRDRSSLSSTRWEDWLPNKSDQSLNDSRVVPSVDEIPFKQAYILGKDDPLFSSIVSSISAIVFLATPHRGSNLADILNRILAASIFNHSPKLYISELKNGSQTIEALNDQFRHIAPSLKLFSFYETLPTAVGPKKMVSWSLAHRGEQAKVSLDGRGKGFGDNRLPERDFEIYECRSPYCLQI